jgi:hypothetical protein
LIFYFFIKIDEIFLLLFIDGGIIGRLLMGLFLVIEFEKIG